MNTIPPIAKAGNKIGLLIIELNDFDIFKMLLLMASTNDKPLPNIFPTPDVI